MFISFSLSCKFSTFFLRKNLFGCRCLSIDTSYPKDICIRREDMDFLAQNDSLETMFTASTGDMGLTDHTDGPTDSSGAAVGGSVGGVLLLIAGLVVVVRRNMERFGATLEAFQRCLNALTNLANRGRDQPPPPPPRTYPRNLTDAERLQELHREAAARLAGEARDQHLYATPASAVWI